MKKNICVLLILACVLLLSGCDTRTPKESPEVDIIPAESSHNEVSEQNSSVKLSDNTQAVLEKKNENEDTVGWVLVPNTYVDDVVVRGVDNDIYLRKNFQKEYDYYGLYFADFRDDFGGGTRADLPLNTVVYGHAITDNPDSEKYTEKFSSLHNFRQEDFVKANPYIFFSTEKENYAFEVFAVFIANADNSDLPYNRPDISGSEIINMINNEVLPRSIWNYEDVSVSEDDKFLTLSTCIYELEDGTVTGYPHTWYRMGIMGKLVDESEVLKTEAIVEYNEDAIVDKDTYPKK